MHQQTIGTQSIWMLDEPTADVTQFERDIAVDVAIVGAGIAGLTTAYMLLQHGQSVAVVDRTTIGGGQTQRTTAHLSNAIDDRYFEIERLHGQEGARLAAESHTSAIREIEQIVRQEGIRCGFEHVDGYLFPGPEHDRVYLERELEAARRAGLADVELLDRLPVPSLANTPCLRFPNQAQFQPMHYLQGLTGAIRRQGGLIFENSHVEQIQGGVPARIVVKNGAAITCKAIVVATNTPVNDRVTMHTKQSAYRTYALAARVPDAFVPRALYWDTSDPYHYVRLHSDDADGRSKQTYLIVGGEDHKTGQPPESPDSYRRLERWARERFAELGEIEFVWSGQVMETLDGLAYIGRNPGDESNVFIATGDSGMGMTHGTIAGLIFSQMIHGQHHPWAGLYDPSRRTVRAVGEFTRENLNTAWQYADWITPGDIHDVVEIPRDCGAIVRSGLRKLAVYRDEDGTLHERSAVCPHLGGIVDWNDFEKSWDCPCHGSRFDRFGRVLCGPANVGLASAGEALSPTPSTRS